MRGGEVLKFLMVFFILSIIYGVFFVLFFSGPSTSSKVFIAVSAILIFHPFIGFLLGTLLALIPYKKRSYGKKYLRASLFGIILVLCIDILPLVLIALRKTYGIELF
jgi:hypothetical protein